ncbi:MAG: class I SAM-dependent RNA methyltransferase [Parachlamydiales bacterium]
MTQDVPLFVTSIPGLDSLLVAEIESLGYEAKGGWGGAYVAEKGQEVIETLNYRLRMAHRVLLPLAAFPCKTKKELYEGARGFEWGPYLKQGWTVAVDVNGVTDELRNTQFSAQVVKDGLCDRLREEGGWRPSVDRKTPDVQLALHLDGERAVLYYDTSRVPLYKRGYRRESVRAPVQESLAAGMLMVAGYTGEEVLCDPCCGSGTLLIEAAMIGSHMPAGFFRTGWGFQRLPGFDQKGWEGRRAEWDGARRPLPGRLVGIDKSGEAVAACKANLQGAGIGRRVEVRYGEFQRETVKADLVVANPPYGIRLGGDLPPLYRELQDFIRRSEAHLALILSGWEGASDHISLPLVQATPVLNGGLECTLYELEGSHAGASP